MPNWLSPIGKWLFRLKKKTFRQFAGEPSMLHPSEMLDFSSGARSPWPFRSADTGQGYPRWGIARGKSIDQALSNFVVDRDGCNLLQRPGFCPVFSVSTVQCPGHHEGLV
jgi:hypothetical protein